MRPSLEFASPQSHLEAPYAWYGVVTVRAGLLSPTNLGHDNGERLHIGTAPIIVRLYALGDSNPVFYSVLRTSCSIPLTFLASVVAERSRPTSPKKWKEVAILALLGMLLLLMTLKHYSYFAPNMNHDPLTSAWVSSWV